MMYYGRFGTPITFAVQKALAELEVPIFTGAYRAGSMHQCITGSGKSGDHILVSSSVYGPTRGFVNNVLAKMERFGNLFRPYYRRWHWSTVRGKHYRGVYRISRLPNI
nr:PLP-dependent transferase [Klebsiella pneumoniae subsp. pneumoniae]